MVLKETNIDPEQLMHVRDRPLVEAYETHDIGQDRLVARLETYGFEVIHHGDDARHADEVFFGNGPDLLVCDGDTGEELCYIEVKCKESAEWFGRCNRRHFDEYVAHAAEVDVPVFIWFALVESGETTIHREAFIEVEGTESIEGDVWDVTNEHLVVRDEDVDALNGEFVTIDGDDIVEVEPRDMVVDGIPDVHGNDVVELDDKRFRSWEHVLEHITSDTGGADTDSVDIESNTELGTTVLDETLRKARDLLRTQLQPNPSDESVVQLRTAKGRVGPRINDRRDIGMSLTERGEVVVTVDDQTVTVGTVKNSEET